MALPALGIAAAWLVAAGEAQALARPGRVEGETVKVVQTTADLAQRLTRLPDERFGSRHVRGVQVIRVDDHRRGQRVAGFGAAMTDTAAWLLHDRLAPPERAAVMRRLFGARGIGLSFARVPIGASDFTRDGVPYTYADAPPGQSDPTLSTFSVAHDDADIVPMLQQMRAINGRVNILATPWSPPGWMKSNGSLDNLAGRAELLPSAYQPLADYFVRFLQAYARRGLRIDAITPANEPGAATGYPGMNWPAPRAARWIVSNLAPALRAAKLDTSIYGLDSNWAGRGYARSLTSHPGVAGTIAGVAWHCYYGNPRAMTAVHVLAPRLRQLVTECSSGISPGPTAEMLIASLRNWANGALLWNIALDPRGGPVQSAGCQACTAVVTVDARTGAVGYTRDYYELGQASAFIRPGARRLASNTFVTYNSTALDQGPSYATAGLDNVAFRNRDGSRVLLVFNNSRRSQRFAVSSRGRSFGHTLASQATATFVWDRP
ncbi:MAG: glucosylceramidase [Solirubrobacteraceae bacterium]|jgi:glucosylceramidase|nr:glucosylceramidase [Solirubrobacteraceae bacterium]